ncbi:NEQ084 [Nanoarchaeum equitans Kin4-M]|uniref:NEQ084 n=1 Tax=Nanoarchaeum equitans (strain Kin4-M) TaxID=228908 RepID=Q74MI4_NANEQ|nr:NEQ084 [Nanoarchaeum equitans Kin4-M]
MKVVPLDFPLGEAVKLLEEEDLLASKKEDTVLGTNEYVLLKKSAWKMPVNTKFESYSVPIPTIDGKNDYEIAKLMFETRFLELPNEDLTKSIHYTDLLKKYKDKIITNPTRYFGDYIDVQASETVLAVLYEMKRQKVEYATVLEGEKPIGVISLKDIFSKIIFPKKKPREGEFVDEYDRPLKLPIREFVNDVVIETDDIKEVIELMLDKNVRSVPLLVNGRYVGTITVDEILKEIGYIEEKGKYFIHVHSNVDLYEDDYDYIEKEFVRKVWRKYKDYLETATLYLDIKREKGVLPDNIEYFWHVSARLITPKGKFVARVVGPSLYSAIKMIMRELVYEIKKKKEESIEFDIV